MKPTREIIGLRVISISDGTQVGVVKDLVLNQQSKSLDFMIIDQPSDYFGAKVIPYADILGLGEFAITIPYPDVIQDVAQNAEVQNLLKQDIRVIGTQVLTKKGQLIGAVTEIIIDEETGHIASCLFESEGQLQEIEVEKIITLGKELLIIEGIGEAAASNQEIIMISNEEDNQTQTIDDFQDIPVEVNSLDFGSVEEVDLLEEEVDTIEEHDAFEQEADFNLFEQRQLQYFIGKKVDKDIILDNADLLRAGECITSEMVTHITTRSTLMEVTSHLQKS
ncbi:PRC-barrel domain-containing protein [Desulfosporosinus sp.]|uniref:PRC-barrel domain-containing protein n=1 Tax=Desulfosporosinus sp. TaxID=157907 RepID=UPI0025C0EE5C|nr:PRC-barrel domain-containing protein [Desulfosporosinus sp.]MBC2727639.1 PRC-barrel domain-containing protein [Desulfosporosinus sp.]